MKAKKKWMFLGLTVLVVVASGLGYWKRIGIRNTLYRMLDKQIPLTGDVYGYYGQEVKVKKNLNEETSFQMEDSYADKIDTTITKESSMLIPPGRSTSRSRRKSSPVHIPLKSRK